MLDLAIALELPGRVIEAVRQYITDAGAAMESKDVADQAAREARESWRQVESMAERGEDLFDGGGKAGPTNDGIECTIRGVTADHVTEVKIPAGASRRLKRAAGQLQAEAEAGRG